MRSKKAAMTLDDLVIHHSRQAARGKLIDLCAAISLGCFLAMTGYTMFIGDPRPAFIAPAVAIGLSAFFYMVFLGRRYRRYSSCLSDAFERCVPFEKQIAAIRMYGWNEGRLAAVECAEAHLPGDCPLCGAE